MFLATNTQDSDSNVPIERRHCKDLPDADNSHGRELSVVLPDVWEDPLWVQGHRAGNEAIVCCREK